MKLYVKYNEKKNVYYVHIEHVIDTKVYLEEFPTSETWNSPEEAYKWAKENYPKDDVIMEL